MGGRPLCPACAEKLEQVASQSPRAKRHRSHHAENPPPTPGSVAAFYEADSRRQYLPEVVFGRHWKRSTDPTANYDLRWLESTGECVLIRVAEISPEPNFLLDVALAYWDLAELRGGREPMTVEVVATDLSLDEVEDRLDGWQDAIQESDGVDWLRARLAKTQA